MAQEHHGGCHCGNARISFFDQPELTFFCHCKDCQRTTGSPFSVELMVAAVKFHAEGKLATYTVTGDSGKHVHRRACAQCGSGLFLECDADPGYVFVKVGALDDASWVTPEMHIYTATRQTWVQLSDGLPEYEQAPPA